MEGSFSILCGDSDPWPIEAYGRHIARCKYVEIPTGSVQIRSMSFWLGHAAISLRASSSCLFTLLVPEACDIGTDGRKGSNEGP
jgi:hypothetical protein